MRRSPMKRSRGTVIPDAMRVRIRHRDGGCVGLGRFPGVFCAGVPELDHVRAGGMGMKSITCDCNLVSLCSAHHRYKTEHGRTVRPILLAYLERFDYAEHSEHAAVAS